MKWSISYHTADRTFLHGRFTMIANEVLKVADLGICNVKKVAWVYATG